MSLPDTLRSFASALEDVGHAVAALSTLTKSTADDKAADVLKLIGTGLDAILRDLGVKIDPAEVAKHIDVLRSRIEKNDAAINGAIADKFDKG